MRRDRDVRNVDVDSSASRRASCGGRAPDLGVGRYVRRDKNDQVRLVAPHSGTIRILSPNDVDLMPAPWIREVMLQYRLVCWRRWKSDRSHQRALGYPD